MEPTLQQLRDFFQGDRFAINAGAGIDSAEKDHAVCSMALGPTHLNAGNNVMGGVMFTLADFAFAVAANFSGKLTVTLSSQISFLRPPKGRRLIAEATCVHQSKRIVFYNIAVSDEMGTQVATVTATGYRNGADIPF